MRGMDLFSNSENKNNLNRYDIIDILEDYTYCIENLPENILGAIVFKGGLALISAMSKYGKLEYERLTTDLDLQCSNKESWELFKKELVELGKYSRLNLKYSFQVKRPLEKNNISETLDIIANDSQGNSYNFNIDMNLNNGIVTSENYKGKYLTLDFEGYSVETMLSDKLKVFSERKLLRRVKDLHDINAISNLKNYTMNTLVETFINKHNKLETSEIFGIAIDNVEDIRYAYNKLKGIKNKKDFELIYNDVLEFTIPIYHAILTDKNLDITWNCNERMWK